MRSILKDFSRGCGDPETLLLGGWESRRLVGVLREKRYSWAQVIFHKFYRRKFPSPEKVDFIVSVPQRKQEISGLTLFCKSLSRASRAPYALNALTKTSPRVQHGLPARARLDRERFISLKERNPGRSILLIDDVETTGTSFLQAETSLREADPERKIQRLTLVKVRNREEEDSKNKSTEV
jgi:predicted amidophosphoribosyltransferase